MKSIKILASSLLLYFVLHACVTDSCRNSNKILGTYGPEEALYKIELGKVLKDGAPADSKFHFEELRELYSDTIIVLKLKGPSLCAIVQAKVKSWQGIEALKKTLGKGYKGAEIKGIRLTMSDSLTTIPIFYFRGATTVVD